MLQKINTKNINKILLYILIFITIFCIIVARRPDIIFNAQPWAEDGLLWMADAYNFGFWHPLLQPHTGYYQTISRLTYGIALLGGVSYAPVIANIIAISIRCFCCMFILSKRISFIELPYRIAAVVYFLLMPNVYEGYVNITNIHWYLSLYLFLIIFADNPLTLKWKIHDFIILVISGLSGPFIALLAPCLFIKRIVQHKGVINSIKRIDYFDLVVLLCCLVQIYAFLTTLDQGRVKVSLGANFSLFANIISFHIIEGSFLSTEVIAHIAHNSLLNITLLIVMLLIIIPFCYYGGWRFFIAFLFPTLIVAFALKSPMISNSGSQWPLLLFYWVAGRYFYVSNFAFFCFILFLISKAGFFSKTILISLMIIMMPLFLSYFSMPPLENVGYKEDIQKFISLPKGQEMSIRVNPPGWHIILKKK